MSQTFFKYGAELRIKKTNQLMKLHKLLNWKEIRRELKGLKRYEENNSSGARGYDGLKLFKAILLGQWHNLSDEKLEESLQIRIDFMIFTGFLLGEDLPDTTTFCRFRNRMNETGLAKRVFKQVQTQLENLGLKIKTAEAALVDATIIESAARPNRLIEADLNEIESSEVLFGKPFFCKK